MEIKIYDNKPGIYVIRNLTNQKVYVGKSKNIYKRLHQHLSDIKILERNYNENPHLLNSVLKYGIENFDYYVIEYFEEYNENLEALLSERELFWMNKLDCLNPEKGYNLRYDSEGNCFVSNETREKISIRLKKEWKDGIRSKHSEKLKSYWENNDIRKLEQSKIMSKNKTKYSYDLYKDDVFIENCDYKRLCELELKNSITDFSKKKTDEIKFKGYKIIRINKD